MLKFVRMKFGAFWMLMALALCVALAWGVKTVYARQNKVPQRLAGGFETTLVVGSANFSASIGTFGPDNIIFGFSVLVTTDGGVCGLYDVATVQGATEAQGVFIDEGGGASDGDVFQSDWYGPYTLVTDLTVLCTNANAIIYHYPL